MQRKQQLRKKASYVRLSNFLTVYFEVSFSIFCVLWRSVDSDIKDYVVMLQKIKIINNMMIWKIRHTRQGY